MIPVSILRIQKVQKKFQKDLDKQYKTAFKKLREIAKTPFDNTPFRAYLDTLVEQFDANKNILTATPLELEDLKKAFGELPDDPEENLNEVSLRILLKNKITTALGYTGLRRDFYPKYFAGIGIKSCVYCNSQLAVSIEKDQKVYSGRFQVDHFNSQDEFPWMAISLFNLYPSCASCNGNKSNDVVIFELYTNDRDKLRTSPFVFRLDPGSKAKYLTSRDPEDIKYNFEDRCKNNVPSAFGKKFHIDAVYATQVDLVEEILLKSQMYDETYRKTLSNNFSKLGISNVSIERIILGNYVKEIEIHKRPLAKFMQDLAIELKLIARSEHDKNKLR